MTLYFLNCTIETLLAIYARLQTLLERTSDTLSEVQSGGMNSSRFSLFGFRMINSPASIKTKNKSRLYIVLYGMN